MIETKAMLIARYLLELRRAVEEDRHGAALWYRVQLEELVEIG